MRCRTRTPGKRKNAARRKKMRQMPGMRLLQRRKKSLIKRIGDALFGEEEETEETPADAGELQPEGLEQAPELDDLSDENLKLLQELEGTGAAEPEAEAEPEISEEEKKAQAKKEKQRRRHRRRKRRRRRRHRRRRRRQRKSTESQEAEEAEGAGQYTAASEKAGGADYGHGGVFPRTCAGGNESVRIYLSFNSAKQAYELGDYQAAFADVSGLTVKEADQETYQKYSIMANAAGEYQAYQTFMETVFMIWHWIPSSARSEDAISTARRLRLTAAPQNSRRSETRRWQDCPDLDLRRSAHRNCTRRASGIPTRRNCIRYWRQQDLDDIDGVRE